MLLQVPALLDAPRIQQLRQQLEAAPWVDGRVTAGHQSGRVKQNRQIAEDTPLAHQMGDVILGALERNPLFISAVLPNRVYPPLFNRYDPEMNFGSHVDNAVRQIPGSGAKIRTDVSATLFLSQPDELPDSYQRYLVNGLREPFGLSGVPIRLLLRASKNPYVED